MGKVNTTTSAAAVQSNVTSKGDISLYVKAINRSLEDFKVAIKKSLDDDDSVSDERKEADMKFVEQLAKIQDKLNDTKKQYKEVADRKKKVSTGNLGLRGPHFTTANLIDFINTHATLPPNLHLKINGAGYGLFDRSTLTKFFSFYSKSNNLKDEKKKGMYITDSALNKLFGSVIVNPKEEAHTGKTYYQVMVEYIKKMRLQPNHKPNNTNRAQFEPADSDGTVIKAFNNAALQVLVKPFFRNGYTPSNKEEHVAQLSEIKKHLHVPEVAAQGTANQEPESEVDDEDED